MKKAFILPDKCLRCSTCHAARACPIKAIFCIDSSEPAIVDSVLCHGCGDCLVPCPAHAVILKEG